MHDAGQVRAQVQRVLGDMQYLVRLLYVVPEPQTRNLALQQLWNQIGYLQFLTGLPAQEAGVGAAPAPAPATGALPAGPGPGPALTAAPAQATGGGPALVTAPAHAPAAPSQTFTREQLATFTGRNGQPAYVAVNGTVYDVTDHKAWSAASHFGLPAGRDLTAEFASCHAAQQWILGTLRPVGRLA